MIFEVKTAGNLYTTKISENNGNRVRNRIISSVPQLSDARRLIIHI